MSDRDERGRFVAGNRTASQGGRARAAALPPQRRQEISQAGWRAMVERHFGGDEAAAKDWFVRRGLWEQDKHYWEMGFGLFADPGPHPAALVFDLDQIDELEF